MFLMYVDESGDPGALSAGSRSRYFVLSGLVLHELRWHECLDTLVAFRKQLRDDFGLKVREEIHAGRLIARPGALKRLPKHERLAILRQTARQIGSMSDFNLITVAIDKLGKSESYNTFQAAWKILIQRFEDTMQHRNFRAPVKREERGMILPDATDEGHLRKVLRAMRRHNPISHSPQWGDAGYRQKPLSHVIEDPNLRQSNHSLFVQCVDVCAYLALQHLKPNSFMKRKGGARLYENHLLPIASKAAVPGERDRIKRL